MDIIIDIQMATIVIFLQLKQNWFSLKLVIVSLRWFGNIIFITST